ncbi:hypothetical protein EPO15_18535 [bacterium]|nr:MAG: hypothetical protein EPO15_18535 [bacterium]
MRRAALLALALAAACGKPAPEPAKAPAQPAVGRALDALRVVAPCDKVVSLDWAHGWPVPAEGGPSRFAVFFYPLGGSPDTGPRLGAPSARAVFDAKAGVVLECGALPAAAAPAPGARWPAAAAGLDMAGFEARATALYAAAEAAASGYARGDAAAAAAYWAAFDGLAEPALRADYYRLNPAFWDWLRAKTGKALDRPKD